MKPFPQGITHIGKLEDVADALWIVNEMHKFGHAVQYSDSSRDGKFLEGLVIHYRTCRACFELEQEKRYAEKENVRLAAIQGASGVAGTDQRGEARDGRTRDSGSGPDIRYVEEGEKGVRRKDQGDQHGDGGVLSAVGGTSPRSGRSEDYPIDGRDSVLTERSLSFGAGQGAAQDVGRANWDGGDFVGALPDTGRPGKREVEQRRRTTSGSRSVPKDKGEMSRKLKKEKKHGKK